ncbi:hypothetical protein NP233_g4584 [Leucocoprinus birnbaumii]|uniref:Uncharacterized protein n=1 Tax=Leucocoprinus birnbaumii TaxID=56174 RepID=A0AAD5YSP5_9AGAR|nr:hypothetical protein NP233_g4584 [Leucocoprinus birnbaumii]
MNTFSAFRSVAVELLHLNSRHNIKQALPRLAIRPLSSLDIPYRHIHTSHARRGTWVKNSQPAKKVETPEQKKARMKKEKEIGLKNGEIPYQWVQVASPGGLGDPRTLDDVLREVHSLNALAHANENDVERKKTLKRFYAQLIANDPTPIVKIINSYELYKKQKQAQEKTKAHAANNVRKEVQLTWASSEADVETKLQRVKEELGRGFKVDLAIMPKKNLRPPRRDEMVERADELAEHFAGIAKEWKVRDYTRTTVVIYFQGSSNSTAAVAATDADKKPKKVLLKEQRRQAQEEKLKKKQELEARSSNNFEGQDQSSLS